MHADDSTAQVHRLAREAGFERVGIALAGPVPRSDYVRDWLARGLAGEMAYLHEHLEQRLDASALLPDARSVIVVADNYAHDPREWDIAAPASSSGDQPPRGRIAQYAWGRDYHRVLKKKLYRLADRLHSEIDETFETRVCVDTAPILEREAAAMAGIGWIGKNTMVLHQELGSFFFLGEIVTTLALSPTPPVSDHCGTCTRCLDACPTDALAEPYRMDATRCISYLTIEHRGDIDEDLGPLMDDWVFGCDICQDVCPYNGNAPVTNEPEYLLRPENPLPPRPRLDELVAMADGRCRDLLTGSAMKRAKPAMLRRNAIIARRNVAHPAQEDGATGP